nr:MAG: polyprotein P1 [Hedgehog dicipivirus 3]
MAPNRSRNVSAINVTGPIAELLRPFPVVGAVAGALTGLASSWLSKTTNGLLNNSGFEIGTGTSDRILSVTAGSCGTSAQEAVTVRDGWAGDVPVKIDAPCSDKPTLPGPAAERLEYVHWATWGENAAIDTNIFPIINIPQCLYANDNANPSTTFLPNAMRHHYSRANFTVVVTVNANPFTAGVLCVVAIPNFPILGAYPSDEINTMPISQLTLFPHQFINLKTNNQATLILPYHGPGPVFDHSTTSLYRLCGIVFSKIVKTSAMAGGEITYNIQVAPSDVEFYGLRPPANPIPLDGTVSANAEGLAVRLAPNAASITTTAPLDDVVVLAQGSQTELSTSYLPGRVSSFCQPLTVPTRMTMINGSNGGFNVGSADTTGNMVYAFPVDLANVMFADTYLGNLAQLFCHWTGELTFSLLTAANSMTRGRLLVSFLPGTTEYPKTMQLAMLGTYQIYDIGLNSTFIFPIPYICNTSWRRTTGYATGSTPYNRLYDPLARAGVVSVWVYSTFQTPAPNNATTVSFIPFISSGKDFSFRLPVAPPVFVPPYPTSARHEAPDPVVHMGSGDAAEASTAPTQADVDSTPTSYSNIESGQPTNTDSADVWEGMTGFTAHTSPDMLLSNFFGRMRLHHVFYGSPPPGSGNPDSDRIGTRYLVPLYWGAYLPGERPTAITDALTSMFLYCQADVRVDVFIYPTSGYMVGNDNTPNRVTIEPNARNSSRVKITNLPPGFAPLAMQYSTGPAFTQKMHPQRISCFPTTCCVLGAPATTMSVYIPYQSMYNALPSEYSGFNNFGCEPASDTASKVRGSTFGYLPDREFCTLMFDMALASYYTFEVYVSYHNIQTFIPRPVLLKTSVKTVPDKTHAFALNNGYNATTGNTRETETRAPTYDFFERLMLEPSRGGARKNTNASGVNVTNP